MNNAIQVIFNIYKMKTGCPCPCEKEETYIFCAPVPKCIKTLTVLTTVPNKAYAVNIDNGITCHELTGTSDALGNLVLNIPIGVIRYSWLFGNYYKLFGNDVIFVINGKNYCSIEFETGRCKSSIDNFTIA
jgi:hypothetical protein